MFDHLVDSLEEVGVEEVVVLAFVLAPLDLLLQ